MNFDLVPIESVKRNNLKPTAEYFLNITKQVFCDHGLRLDVSDIIRPNAKNFIVSAPHLRLDNVDAFHYFSTIEELDKNVGNLIRLCGSGKNSPTWIQDKFLPFSEMLIASDYTFRNAVEEERAITKEIKRIFQCNGYEKIIDLAQIAEIDNDGKIQAVATRHHDWFKEEASRVNSRLLPIPVKTKQIKEVEKESQKKLRPLVERIYQRLTSLYSTNRIWLILNQ